MQETRHARLKLDRGFSQRKLFLAGVALRTMARGVNTYQPVMFRGKPISRGIRDTEPRIKVVLDTVESVGADTVIDLGCAEGYFVRRVAESGCLAIGVDADVRRLALAQWSLTLDGVDNFGFVRSQISSELLGRLPTSDVTVCLSLLHHVMYEHGEEYASTLVKGIAARTRKAMVFEMGQSNEIEFGWSKHLPDMGNDPHDWIADFLTRSGFASVRKALIVPSYNSDVGRATLVATPSTR